MSQKSDSVFLLTLVDLLVQIIFLALFVGAIYLADEGRGDIEKKRISDPKAKIIVEVGVLKVAELVDSMVKLVPFDRLMELAVLLPEFKSIEALKAALRLAEAAKFDSVILDDQKRALENRVNDQKKDTEKKISSGVGLPTCLIDANNNSLFRLREQDGFYLITKISSKAKEFAAQSFIHLEEGARFNYQQLETLGNYIAVTEKTCRYNVEYEPTIDSLRAFRYVRKYFYTLFLSALSAAN